MDFSDLTTQLTVLMVAAGVGVLAALTVLARQGREARAGSFESPFAAPTQGEQVCPNCAMSNLWLDAACVGCGRRLPG